MLITRQILIEAKFRLPNCDSRVTLYKIYYLQPFVKFQVSKIFSWGSPFAYSAKNNPLFMFRQLAEFCGIGKRPIEDTNKIILTIGDALGVQINEEDISFSHRLPQNKHNVDKPPIIIAKFVRRDTKENLYRARSKYNDPSSGLSRR